MSKEFLIMNMKKIFAAMAATAVSASAFAAMTLTSANAADQIGSAYLSGSFGTEASWDATDGKNPAVVVDGDAQYECTWTVSQATTPGASCFLTVVISPVGVDNFATATFPDLAVTLDEVWVDGTQLTGYDASNAVNTNYFESGAGVTRVYLRSDWADDGLTKILADDQSIESEIKVLFTVSGTGQEGTSNVTAEEPTTEAPTTTAATTTAAGATTTTGAATTTKAGATTTKAANGGKTETSTNTGVAGVGVAASALALAGVAAFVARKKD